MIGLGGEDGRAFLDLAAHARTFDTLPAVSEAYTPAHFESAVARSARALLPPGSRVLCATSGGPDSAALAAALSRLAGRLRLADLVLAHVNHQLRPSSAEDARTAGRLAEKLGLPILVRSVTVAGGDGVEDGARRARYGALAEMARETGATHVAAAHTRTDQAETVLLRLLRGAGPRGLSAMAASRALDGTLRLVRPLLSLPRARVHAYVAALALPSCRDPTNDDLRFRRNALREKIWPALLALSPALERRLSDLAEIARADEAALDALAAAAMETLDDPGGVPARALAALPPAVARRVVRRLAAAAGGGPPAARETARVLALLPRGGTVHLPGDLAATVRRGRLTVGKRRRGREDG